MKLLKILLILSFATATDIDGNVYETGVIGEQLLMDANLNTTHHRNGNEIPAGLSSGEEGEWANTNQGAG